MAVAAGLVIVPLCLTRTGGATDSNERKVARRGQAADPFAASGATTTITAAGESASANKTGSENEMVLHIVADDTGAPVTGATVMWRISEMGGGGNYMMRTNITDGLGASRIPVARKSVDGLFVATRIDGFADLNVDWSARNSDAIPPEYTMRLEHSAPISGRVLNEEGQPVAGAQVEVRLLGESPPLGRRASPHVYHLATETVATDAKGRWRIDLLAKSGLSTISMHVTHPAYASDPAFTEFDGAMDKELLAGTFVYKLDRGVTVSGTVVGPDERPVRDAKVELVADGGRTSATTNQPDGTFALARGKVGSGQLNAQAPGFALRTINVEITRSPAPLRVELTPGSVLRMRVVDTNGAPVSNATVRLNFNPTAPTRAVLRVGPGLFQQQTAADGRVTWEGAPQGELRFTIQAPRYQIAQNLRLTADGEEHQITLHAARRIAGTVRDATTSQPVAEFRVTAGYIGIPSALDLMGAGTNVQWITRARKFLDGTFRYPDGSTAVGALYKIEADGYAPFITRVVGQDEGEVSFDVLLFPAAPTIVPILTPDGKPATNASIALENVGALPRDRLVWKPGGFAASRMNNNLLKSDDAGKFGLPQDDTIDRVSVASPEGFEETTRAALIAAPTIHLRPWGRIEGTFLHGGKPVCGRMLAIARNYPEILTQCQYDAETDTNGRFVFPEVPAGDFRLCENYTADGFRRFKIMGAPAVTVRAGQASDMSVDIYTVAGRLSLPPMRRRNRAGFFVLTQTRR